MQMNAGYAELQAARNVGEHLAERKLWDTTFDGRFGPDEHWTDDGRCVNPEERNLK